MAKAVKDKVGTNAITPAVTIAAKPHHNKNTQGTRVSAINNTKPNTNQCHTDQVANQSAISTP